MFLADVPSTFASRGQNYDEWHQGRPHFGLWYLEIKDQALISYLEQLQKRCADFLYFPNQRQWHITVLVCGFWDVPVEKQHLSNHFSSVHLQQQIAALQCNPPCPFQLKLGKLNSFYSALFVEVVDINHQLDTCRQQLQQYCPEFDAIQYYPHITLGLYREEFPAQQVLQHIQSIATTPFAFSIEHLTFGYYHTHELQGALTAACQMDLR